MTSLFLAATVLCSVQTEQAAEYFPLVPGTKWHYSESSPSGGATYVDEVGAPTEIEGNSATPIVTRMGGRVIDTRYYRVDGDTVLWVAQGDKKPLPEAHPILKVGSGRTKWTFQGDTLFVNESVPVAMNYESSRKGRQKVLESEREMLEVKSNGTMRADGGTEVKGIQVALYAKGVGLTELRSEQTVGGKKSKSLMRLTRFEPAKRD